ncbi:MAG TPA: glycoside hydrolase family 38 C-terminal domain-containing protein [Gemmatimonadales bacterium]|nr:glycoside hydrolase family 38 C-terminal domain-containing protein [Gemmatimonadales bacterium]
MPGFTFHLIPHTHWDREWYLPESTFLTRLVPTLDDLLGRLNSDPAATFLLDGQTILAEDYLRVRPEREAAVSALVRAGRLQVGPWYVLADELIPSGESLIRNLLAGQADSKRLGGRAEVLYSPDAFGHPASWPTLAAEFGMRYGVIWRGLGGEPGQERDLYRWRGPDGREVLVYHLPPDGYEVGAGLPADAERLPLVWKRVRSTLVSRASTRHIPVFIGADHHSAHPALSRLRALLEQIEPDNEFRISKLQDFFAAAAPEAVGLPVICGELRWSYGYTWTLQGVHATRAPLKRRHAITELALSRVAEPLAALALATRGGDRRPLLGYAWRALLQSQFHDSIAGTTSDPVARRVELRLDDVRTMASEISRTSLDELAGNIPDRARAKPEGTAPRLVLWNPVPRRRRSVIVADLSWFRRDVLIGPPGDRLSRVGPGYHPFHLLGPSGEVSMQPLGRRGGQERLDAPHHYPDQDEVDWSRVAFRAPEMGGLGVAALETGEHHSAHLSGTAWQKGRALGNEFLEVRIAPNGSLQLSDRRNQQRFRDLFLLESSGDVGDSYSYCPPVRDQINRMKGSVRVRPLASGPLVAALEARWRLAAGRGVRGERSGTLGVRLIVTLYAGCPSVRCTLELENRGSNHRIRLRTSTGLAGGTATAGDHFGVTQRPAVSANPRAYPGETPVTTAPAHRFVARASGPKGLAIFAPGFFEYELERKGDLLVTLLRSVGELSRGDLPTRPGHAGWPVATPLAQCHGVERLQLAFAPVTETELDGGTVLPELWEDIFLPVRGVWLRQASPLSPVPIDVRLEGYGLVFSGLKPAEQGEAMVLRCYNATARPTAGLWHLGEPVSSAQRARADESPLHDIRLGEGGRIVPFHAAAHEIVTIMVALAPSG